MREASDKKSQVGKFALVSGVAIRDGARSKEVNLWMAKSLLNEAKLVTDDNLQFPGQFNYQQSIFNHQVKNGKILLADSNDITKSNILPEPMLL